MSKRPSTKTKEKFIEEAELVYGVGTYDYSDVVYVNRKTPVKIKCKRPHNHLEGQGCPECTVNRIQRIKET